MLAVGAIHFRLSRGAVVRRFLTRLLGELLAYRYAEAWLLCEAIADHLKGPAFVRQQAEPSHRRLLAIWRSLLPEPAATSETPPQRPAGPRLSRGRRLVGVLWQVARNLLTPVRPNPQALPTSSVTEETCDWQAIGGADLVALTGPDLPVPLILRRSRWHFARLLGRGVWLSLRLLVEHRQAIQVWRLGTRELTERQFWNWYLGLVEQPATPHAGSPAREREFVCLER
jgi:hypothetical protein